MSAFVFGYGSLTTLADPPPSRAPDPRGYVTELPGHRRRWGVAADNRSALPGYKRYRDGSGAYPPVAVAFLDLAPGDGAVNGVCLPVAAQALAALDARERNYERVEVTAQIAHALGPTWAYVGSARAARDSPTAARAAPPSSRGSTATSCWPASPRSARTSWRASTPAPTSATCRSPS